MPRRARDKPPARGRRERIPIGPFGYRSGSLPDRLLRWARARSRPFRAAEVAETLGLGIDHARRLLGVTRAHLKPLGRGVRVEAGVHARASRAVRRKWRRAAKDVRCNETLSALT